MYSTPPKWNFAELPVVENGVGAVEEYTDEPGGIVAIEPCQHLIDFLAISLSL
jgi:hypothetical protein